MSTAPPVTSRRWDEPEGVEARGTVLVLAGRGETASVYARFGRRLAADAYRVRVVSDVTAPRQRTIELARNLIGEEGPRPLVVLGADTGALAALRLVTPTPQRVSGVICVGLPVRGGVVDPGVPQLPLRTRSPEHWTTLTDPGILDPEALGRDIPERLAPPNPRGVSLPVLGIHGALDPVAPLDGALEYYAALPDSRVVVVDRGLHDSLNDAAHRSVAAAIVLFLEELRHGAPTVTGAPEPEGHLSA